MTASFFEAEHMTVCYNGEPVVQDVSFEVKPGEILGIVGESGSGKSTIIKAIMGLLGEEGLVTQGDIWFKGKNLTDMSQKELRPYLGKEIGVVFQDCKASLCPVRTVGAQIRDAVAAHEKVSKKEVYQRAGRIMEKIGLQDWERVLKSYSFQLSGGMNQRVGICMAMLLQPGLLLADEPTSALDVTVQKRVVEELLLMREEYHTAMILVTHNLGVVRHMADRILVLQNGQVKAYGKASDVLDHPEDPYTRRLMDSVLHLKRTKKLEG